MGVAEGVDSIRIEQSGTEVRHLEAVRTLPGVVVLNVAASNGPGMGRLKTSGDGTLLAWQAPGSSTFGTAVDVSADDTYLLADGEDADKWIRVEVYADYLAPTPRSTRVHLKDLYENGPGHDDVTAAEASAGDVVTYELGVANDSAATVYNIRAWLDAAADGNAYLELSADEVDWSTPTSEPAGVELGNVLTGNSATLYVRRTIPASESYDPDLLAHLHFGFDDRT